MSEETSEADSARKVAAYVRPVDLVTSALLLTAGFVLALDNWRIGAGWASDGPRPGFFPFGLAVILMVASAWGLFTAARDRSAAREVFVETESLKRVFQVLVPTILFVVGIKYAGLYASSALLIFVFMIWLGRLGLISSVLTSLGFAAVIFWMFEIQFRVLLPKGPIEAWLGF